MQFRQHEPIRPFPTVPQAVKDRYALGALALRPFGLYRSDLSLDFDRTPRPVLVTRLLECCTRSAQEDPIEQSLFWQLPVGKRIECLLTLLLSGTGSEIPLAFRCPNTSCEEMSEMEVSLEEVAMLQEEAYVADRVEIPLGNEVLALRRPTGNDQLGWLNQSFADRGAALRVMVGTLLLNGKEGAAVLGPRLRDDWLDGIEEAMEEHDPLVNFKLTVRCPSCESEHVVGIDLQDLSLRRLRQTQSRLLASVHRLAAHYHWSERQIFAVPHWRRTHYLSLIDNEKNQ
jgi:hypothetical protein